jgi:hypothetical protein
LTSFVRKHVSQGPSTCAEREDVGSAWLLFATLEKEAPGQ